MKLFQILLLLTSFFPLTGKAQPLQKKWKTLSESNYSIQYPEDWDLNQSRQMGISFILLTKQTSEQDQFRDNINLLIQDLSGYNLDLDKYVKLSQDQVKTQIINGVLHESKRMEANGKSFHKVIYSGKQGIYSLKFEQYYWIKSNNAYVLTLTCEADQFNTYQVIGEKIMNSFRFD